MKQLKSNTLSRRDFMRLSAAAAAGITLVPSFSCKMEHIPAPMKRRFGKTGFEVTTLGLGGQSSLQWTPEGVDPVSIILKAFDLGINYFDTSNVYGPSQLNYSKAFRKLTLIPGEEGYDKSLRDSVFLTTKTLIRWAKGNYPDLPGVRNNTNGDHGEGAVADLKRSLSQMFGDNQGNYPEGAYVNMILIHALSRFEEIDVLYRGLETPLNKDENFGALVALRDFRDGTNITGLNPRNEKLVKHIGFSGHYSSPVMMEMIRRDKYSLLDGMLVAINVNDRRYLNMQYNVIPLAQARDIGVIGMKVFSDGAMYTKEARWSWKPEDVVLTVGSEDLPSRPLIEYALTTPGVHTVITGIGHVDEDPLKCQLVQNFYAAQIKPDALSEKERRELENLGMKAKDGKSNYFQMDYQGLQPPVNVKVEKGDKTRITWDTAIAGDEPLSHYEIIADGVKINTVPHKPQVSTEPFSYTCDAGGKEFRVVAVDAVGGKAESELFKV